MKRSTTASQRRGLNAKHTAAATMPTTATTIASPISASGLLKLIRPPAANYASNRSSHINAVTTLTILAITKSKA
jgi:hypothetical protein